MELTKRQIKAIVKAEKLILEAQEIFNNNNLGKYWCPIFGQTETSINNSASHIKNYANYKLKRN